MTLTPCAELSPADWITTSAWPWHRLVGFGPEGFATYARLRFVPDPAFEGQSENGAASEDAPSETAQVRLAVASLSAHTQTPDDCYFGWWDGWGRDVTGLPAAALQASVFHVPNRSYFLLRGSLADFDTWSAGAANTWQSGPAFIWPADRAWCLAHDVDPHWAGIGATTAAIDQLRAEPRLDVVPADPEDSQPEYR